MTLAETFILIARIVFGGFFLIAGARNFIGFKSRLGMATNYGWVLPTPLLIVGFAMQVLGGLSLVLGVWTGIGALVLIAFTIAATALYHNLFMFQGEERAPHLYFTLVNITLVGGLLQVIAGTL